MWGLLKSKVSEFISKITGEAKKEEGSQTPPEEPAAKQAEKTELQKVETAPTPIEGHALQAGTEGKIQEKTQAPIAKDERKPPETAPAPSQQQAPTKEEKRPAASACAPVQREVVEQKPAQKEKERAAADEEVKEKVLPKPVPEQPRQQPAAEVVQPPQPTVAPGTGTQKKEEQVRVKIGITDHLKKMVLRKVRLSRERVEGMALDLEFALIQSDVHPDVAKEVCERIVQRISDREFTSSELENEVKNVLREVLREEAFGANKPFDIVELAKSHIKKPFKILFVGPNGAGKTTTIAKVAHKLMEGGLTVVISASDTFRAAAIEQSEEHGRRLGVRVIRHNYGADSAAVAFDAIRHAEANNIDVVLIDSAGRQDTNSNLIRELEKLNRIAAPDLRIFVGESLAGNSLYQQVKVFNDAIKLDGIILTKADCDSKGGTAISILRETGVPIIYLGMGQKYDDLVKFDPEIIISNIL
ncbi:MAG: signal recognition particle-docking protein FtsY [Candidatus Micrarchaeia archaeon]